LRPAFDWPSVRGEFEPDGSLRDIYMLDTTANDWQTVLDHLRRSGRSVRFEVGGVEGPLPDQVSTIFGVSAEATPLLNFDVGGVDLACHFFTPSEIEFDFLPTDVQGPERLQSVLEFMAEIGQLLAKTVVLTPENGKAVPIFKYDATSDRTLYCPPSAA
jgi:hypothetical protein